jgi:hypothetical protein
MSYRNKYQMSRKKFFIPGIINKFVIDYQKLPKFPIVISKCNYSVEFLFFDLNPARGVKCIIVDVANRNLQLGSLLSFLTPAWDKIISHSNHHSAGLTDSPENGITLIEIFISF